MKRTLRKFMVVVVGAMTAWSMFAPTLARADDWRCTVILCLANPGGPEQYAECVPSVEKLWSTLRHGDPFPTCDFNSSENDLPADVRKALPSSLLANLGSGSGASNTWASGSYCREDLLYWGPPEQSMLDCRARGAINVTIDGSLFTRVWWDAAAQGTTITEYYGSGSTQVPYDPAQAATLFLQAQQQQSQQDGSGGGNH